VLSDAPHETLPSREYHHYKRDETTEVISSCDEMPEERKLMSSFRQIVIFSISGLVHVNERFSDHIVALDILAKKTQHLVSGGNVIAKHLTAEPNLHDGELMWSRDNLRGLVFVVVCDEMNSRLLEQSLETVKSTFISYYDCDRADYSNFLSDLMQKLKYLDDGIVESVGKRKPVGQEKQQTPQMVAHLEDRCEMHVDTSSRSNSGDKYLQLSRMAAPSCEQIPSHASFTMKLYSRLSCKWNHQISEQDLKPLKSSLKHRLTQRNVTNDVAELLINTVTDNLLGTKVTSGKNLARTVDQAVEDAISQILTAATKKDVLSEIRDAMKSRRPYVITFVGVNGVGKSTSLSKLVHWLSNQNLTVMVAACDTFRAGAVEQLRTHCQRLQCALFERGYERDPATIALQALQQATRQNVDVVMIDTAGRMQDNEPLMRALAKLIGNVKPDLTLFVGEALVGNEGASQILQFEQRLHALIQTDKDRVIDGIFLSKFDVIDSKVGSALTLVHTSAIPIIFIGTGQTYDDIQTFQPNSVAHMLLRD
jgi:signal recognition particle receptor subunit alpha